MLTGIVGYDKLNVPDPIAVGIDAVGLSWLGPIVKLGIILGLSLYAAGLLLPGLDRGILSFAAMVAIAAVRMGAIRWSWAFPDWLTYKPLKGD